MEVPKEAPQNLKPPFLTWARKILISIVTRYGLKMVGPEGWIASFLINKVALKAWAYFAETWYFVASKLYRENRDKKQAPALEKVEKVLADPTKTPDEKGKAYEDFSNTGR